MDNCNGTEAKPECPRLAFIHIPKTAGTSITNALKTAYGPGTFPGMTTLDYQRTDDETLRSFRFFKGHAYRRDIERLPPGTIRFTVLRDPVRRAISYYNYYRALDPTAIADPFIREAAEIARSAQAVEFIYSDSPFIIEHVRLGQVRQFLSAATLAVVAHRQFLTRALQRQAVQEFMTQVAQCRFVLTCESLALSFPLMATQLGLAPSCRGVSHDNASHPAANADTADVRRALVDVSAVDFECYEHVRQREMAWLESGLGAMIATTPCAPECRHDA